MTDYVFEIMLSCGSSYKSSAIEDLVSSIFVLPVLEQDGEYKKGPIIWVKVANNCFLQFLAWEKAETREQALEALTHRLRTISYACPSVIIEQVIYPEEMSINFLPMKEGEKHE